MGKRTIYSLCLANNCRNSGYDYFYSSDKPDENKNEESEADDEAESSSRIADRLRVRKRKLETSLKVYLNISHTKFND